MLFAHLPAEEHILRLLCDQFVLMEGEKLVLIYGADRSETFIPSRQALGCR